MWPYYLPPETRKEVLWEDYTFCVGRVNDKILIAQASHVIYVIFHDLH